jgi:hypothetical protein
VNVGLFTVAGLFRIINVAALCGVGYYVFQSRFRNQLIQALENEHLKKKRLHEGISQANLESAELVSQLELQRVFCVLAEKRLARWRAYETSIAEQAVRDAALRKQTIADKQHAKSYALQLSQARAALAANIVQTAESQLKNKFASPAAGLEYLQPVITQLRTTRASL